LDVDIKACVLMEDEWPADLLTVFLFQDLEKWDICRPPGMAVIGWQIEAQKQLKTAGCVRQR
jgi:hypothetical protein